jgi:hypothetical protein
VNVIFRPIVFLIFYMLKYFNTYILLVVNYRCLLINVVFLRRFFSSDDWWDIVSDGVFLVVDVVVVDVVGVDIGLETIKKLF